jgi:hypothetical protein
MTLYDRTIADLDVHVAAQTVTSAPSPAQPAPVMVAQEEEPRTGPALPAVNTAERDAAVSARTPPTPPAIVRASKLPALTSSRAAIADAGTTMSLGGIPAAQTVTAPPGPVLEPVRLASAPTASAGLPATTDAVDSMPIEPPQDGAIRGTLDRYADAYSQLDADAAQRVWPMVNRDALSRAFESLESQRVSLGDCRIQVDGTSARARCAGTATWTPKVGSGEHTDERSWTFELSKDAGRWQIVSARVQNR